MLNRRTLLKGMCAGGALAIIPGKSWAAGEEPPAKRFRPWDQHAHLHLAPGNTPEERAASLVKRMDRVGVERIIISQGYCDYKAPTPVEHISTGERANHAGGKSLSRPHLTALSSSVRLCWTSA